MIIIHVFIHSFPFNSINLRLKIFEEERENEKNLYSSFFSQILFIIGLISDYKIENDEKRKKLIIMKIATSGCLFHKIQQRCNQNKKPIEFQEFHR